VNPVPQSTHLFGLTYIKLIKVTEILIVVNEIPHNLNITTCESEM